MGEYRNSCNEEDVDLHLPLHNGDGMRRQSKHPSQLTHPEMRAAMKKPSSLDAEGREEKFKLKLRQIQGLKYDRSGAHGICSQDMALDEAARLCYIVAAKEAQRLPLDDNKLRMSRLKLPTNRTASLLRSGKSREDVAKDAALRVVQQWVDFLRPHVPKSHLARTISEMVHNDQDQTAMLSRSGSMRPPTSIGVCRNEGGYLILRPNPTPPATSPLGIALRTVVPRMLFADERWEFLEDVLSALDLEEEFNQSAPSHILRPNTAARAELTSHQKFEEAFAHQMAPEFEKRKSLADSGQNGSPDRRTALGVCAKLRLSGANGGWATYKQDDKCRVTCWCFSPQVIQKQPSMGDVPGPGAYHRRSASTLQTIRTGKFPSVGAMRAVASEVLLSQRERFV